MKQVIAREIFTVVPVAQYTQWCLGINKMVLDKGGVLKTSFLPYTKELSDAELKRFVLALAEFVKDYK